MTDSSSIYTRVGHTGTEELRFWGHRVFAELVGKTSATQLLVCSMTGRILGDEDMLVVDDIVTAMSSADPRLWPFKITRLATAHGSAAYGMGATFVASQGAIFGVNKFQEIAEVLASLQQRVLDEQLSDEQLYDILRQGTVGFGILYGRHDARFDALVNQAISRGRAERPYMRVALQAARVSREKLKLEPHVFVAIGALCLDMGFTTYEAGLFGMLPLFHDALANAAEGAQQRPAILQRLPADAIQYVGPARRKSERAHAHIASTETR